MATPKTITPHYNRKIQLDQYEPAQFGAEMEVDLDEGDDPEEVYEEYHALLEDAVEREIAARVAAKKADDD